jgi:hypothetical protein
MTIYFDMDGTIADLYGVPDWLGMLLNEESLPYSIAAPLVDVVILRKYIYLLKKKGYDFGIISWTSRGGSKEYNKEVRRTKMEWLKKYFPDCFDEIHIIKYGTPKHWVAKDKGILFDDETQNIEKWNKGNAYNATEIMNFLSGLI